MEVYITSWDIVAEKFVDCNILLRHKFRDICWGNFIRTMYLHTVQDPREFVVTCWDTVPEMTDLDILEQRTSGFEEFLPYMCHNAVNIRGDKYVCWNASSSWEIFDTPVIPDTHYWYPCGDLHMHVWAAMQCCSTRHRFDIEHEPVFKVIHRKWWP